VAFLGTDLALLEQLAIAVSYLLTNLLPLAIDLLTPFINFQKGMGLNKSEKGSL
jgi:hypothetical protein